MPYHTYQFPICKYEVLRIIENHPVRKKQHIYCQRGYDKGGDQGKYKDAK